VAGALPHVDWFFPNDEQVLAFTGAGDLESGCRALIDRGVGCVVATCGADGVLIADADGTEQVPAFHVDVVDTTGCGDSFVAGFLRGLSLGRGRHDAAVLGNAAAALVAQGLGSDAGEFDLEAADEFARATPTAAA
jgi:sugar/nucleoside kinase (ribokinase family)